VDQDLLERLGQVAVQRNTAFSYDKDIPVYSGNFKFEKGGNQIQRILFTVTMFSLQLIVAMVL
jgi:hypothetical protein